MAKTNKSSKSAVEQQDIASGMSVKVGDVLVNAESEYDWWGDLGEAARLSSGQKSTEGSDAKRVWNLNPSIL